MGVIVGSPFRHEHADELLKLRVGPDTAAGFDIFTDRLGVPKVVGYKARPLNGIWATAPYLHNGSVRNLYELLLPAEERTTTFYVGRREVHPASVGFLSGQPLPGVL